jgi:Family of unknown function (DUF6348)
VSDELEVLMADERRDTELEKLLLPYLAASLSRLGGTWLVDGQLVRHRDMVVGVRIDDDEDPDEVHVHFGFELSHDWGPVWDCAIGIGRNRHEALSNVVDLWVGTTGTALVELLTQDGRLAQRRWPDDPLGFPGWHVVTCPPGIRGPGHRRDIESLLAWFAQHRPLAFVSDGVKPNLHKRTQGLKFTLHNIGGESGATVELDGHRPCDEASRSLSELPPLPLEFPHIVRIFTLLLFPARS